MGFVRTTRAKVVSVLKLSEEMGSPVSARPIVLAPCVNMVSAVLMTLKEKLNKGETKRKVTTPNSALSFCVFIVEYIF